MADKKDKTSFSGRWQHKYLENFVKDEKGEWQYRGGYYRYANPNVEEKKVKKSMLTASVISLLGGLGGGLIPAPGALDMWYVVFPLAVTFLMAALLLYKSASLYMAKSPLRDYDYKGTVGTAGVWNTGLMIASASTVIGEIVFLTLHNMEGFQTALLFLSCEILVLISAILWKKAYKEAVYELVECGK